MNRLIWKITEDGNTMQRWSEWDGGVDSFIDGLSFYGLGTKKHQFREMLEMGKEVKFPINSPMFGYQTMTIHVKPWAKL